MDDPVRPGHGRRHRVAIGQVGSDELVGDAVEIGEMADREVVEDPDTIAALDQEASDGRADEARPARDEDGPVQRWCASTETPLVALGSGTQRTFWTNVAGSIRSRCAAIRSSIVSISSSFSRRGWRPSSSSFECWAL